MPAGSITLRERLQAPFGVFEGFKRFRWAKDGWQPNYIRRFLNNAKTDDVPLMGSDCFNNPIFHNQAFKGIATPVKFDIQANGKIAQLNPFFCNTNDNTPLEIVRIDCIFSTADGVANTGTITKDLQGNAAGSGVSCLAAGTTFNLNATANTLQTATDLSGSGPLFLAGQQGSPSLILMPGEQLTLSIANAVTSLAGLSITVWTRFHTGISIINFKRVANADIATSTIYLNLIPGTTVRAISMRWTAAGTDAGAVTVTVTKDTGTTAPGAGTALLAAAQSVKGAPNVSVFPALTATVANLVMAAGDRLAILTAGTLTALAGLEVTVFLSSGPRDTIVVGTNMWDAQATNRTIFLSDAFWELIDFWYVGSTASASGTLQLSKDSGTTAPGSGTTMLTGTVSTAGTANTPVEGTLVANLSTRCLAPGDRLSTVNGGSATSQAGAFVAVRLRRL